MQEPLKGKRRCGRAPIPGDAGFPDFIDGHFHDSYVVKEEWLSRRKVHALLTAPKASVWA